MADNTGLPEGFTIDQQEPQQTVESLSPTTGGNSDLPEGFELDSTKYGSFGQQVKAGVEGFARGVLGPIATATEIGTGMATGHDIQARQEQHPWTSGIAEGIGVAAPALATFGASTLERAGVEGAAQVASALKVASPYTLGGAMGEAGSAAVKATGLGGAGAGFLSQVGAHTVQGAFEGAIFQASDEMSKVLEDPQNRDQLAESAISDIGLAAVMGGVFGGALGAAAEGIKKAGILAPHFVSGTDRPKVDAGDFQATIENSNLYSDDEKKSIIGGLKEQKSDAAATRKSAQNLGIATLPEGMTAASPWVQKADSALVGGAPTYSGIKRQQMYGDVYKKTLDAINDVVGEASTTTKAQLGNDFKNSITAGFEQENQPIADLYQEIKKGHEIIPLADDAGAMLAREIGNIKEAALSPSSPAGQLAKRVVKEVQNLTDVDSVKAYKSIMYDSVAPTASSGEKRMAAIIGGKLQDLENNSIVRFAEKMRKPTITDVRTPNLEVRQVAKDYMASKGMPEAGPSQYMDVNVPRATKIAQAYEDMPHTPNMPNVRKAYNALISETGDQFQQIKKAGLKISRITPNMENPYPRGSKDLFKDINENNHMWFYPTEAGFGPTGEGAPSHPLLRNTSEKVGGQPLVANDVFRIVHDYFGHVKEGTGFGPKGEENAWREHMKMYSPEAQKALTTETRGQNSWVNYGPHGEANRLTPAKTIYARQKAGILPDWAMEIDKPKAKNIQLTHYSPQEGLETIDPEKMGTGYPSAETKRAPSTKTSNFYFKDTEPEQNVVNFARNKYTAELPGNAKLYDLAKDEKGILKDNTIASSGYVDFDAAEKEIKDKGYTGYFNSNHPQLPNAVKVFEPLDVTPAEGLKTTGGMDTNQVLALLEDRKKANAMYKPFIEKVGTLAEQLGKGKVYGVGDATDFIRNRVTPEEMTQKLFSKKDSEFLRFFGKNFPAEMEKMKSYQANQMREEATTNGVFNPKTFFKKLNDLEPEIQRAIFDPVELSKLRDAEQVVKNIPKDFNPSGTAGMSAFQAFFKSPTGAAIANLRDFSIEKFIQAVAHAPEVNRATSLADSTVSGWNTTKKAVKSLFNPESAVFPSSIAASKSARASLARLITDYQANPEKMLSLGVNNPLPQYNQVFAGASNRAVQYFSSIRPKTDKANPLDADRVPSQYEAAAYNRQLDIGQNPNMIFKYMKDDSLIPQDVTTLQTIYPNFYNRISSALHQQLVESVSKGNKIPYRTRLALSSVLGQPMDSTMTSASISSAQPQPSGPPEGGPQQQGKQGKPTKKGGTALSKLGESYQTSTQTAEQRRNKPT